MGLGLVVNEIRGTGERVPKSELMLVEEKIKVYPGLPCTLVLDKKTLHDVKNLKNLKIFLFDDYLYVVDEGGLIVLRARLPLPFTLLDWLSMTFLAWILSTFPSLSSSFDTFLTCPFWLQRIVSRIDAASLLDEWMRARKAVQADLDQQREKVEDDETKKRKKREEERRDKELMRKQAADELRRKKAMKVEAARREDPGRICLEGNAAFKAGNWRRQASCSLQSYHYLHIGRYPIMRQRLRCLQRLRSATETSSPFATCSPGPSSPSFNSVWKSDLNYLCRSQLEGGDLVSAHATLSEIASSNSCHPVFNLALAQLLQRAKRCSHSVIASGLTDMASLSETCICRPLLALKWTEMDRDGQIWGSLLWPFTTDPIEGTEDQAVR